MRTNNKKVGHAFVSPPEDEYLMPLIINDMDPLNLVVRIVKRAWTRLIRIDHEWEKNVVAKEPYILWAKERAQIVKMSFFFESPSFLVLEPEPILQEDVDKLTNKIKEFELENTQLRV